ncbi:MAG: DNA-binding protein, partial [Gemmatimonadetes bacterium]|nr:DNA-binding protein [Gemmatimonadota bacterium]
MTPTAYIETSVVSYLTSRPSRDIVVVALQQVTREWW